MVFSFAAIHRHQFQRSKKAHSVTERGHTHTVTPRRGVISGDVDDDNNDDDDDDDDDDDCSASS